MAERRTQISLAFAGGVAVVVLWEVIRKWRIHRGVAKKIKWKQEQCKAAFDTVEQDLRKAQVPAEKIAKILDLSFTELQQQLQDGTLKAVDVLHAYQSCAFEANERVNAITEPLLDAEAIAEALDKQTSEKKPLHGIPISLKESFYISGLDCTAGLGHFLQNPKTYDAVLVQVLKGLGAVPFVRTNIPQTMMIYECSNPIYGQTNNPYDLSRVPGGSTGGEGALLGSKASIIGFGSDIGGSIRVPCHFCGCYGLKTTLERLSRKGHISLSKGQTLVSGTVGPMTRDFEGLVFATKAILNDHHFQLDPAVPPIKFQEEIYRSKRPLTIGFYTYDGYIQSVPACERAVMMAKKALEAMGHTVIDFVPPRVTYMVPYLYVRSVQGDGGRIFTSQTEKDIEDPSMKKLLFPSKLPKWMLWVLSWVTQAITKDKVLADAIKARIPVKSVYEWFQHAIRVQDYKDEFLNAWKGKNLDAVICPPFAMTAVPNGKVTEVLGCGGYCWLYNVVNYPAGVLPVTRVTSDDVTNLDKYPSTTTMEKLVKKYSLGSAGLPVGVQCAALPFQEELVLRVMGDIEAGLKMLKK
ncbi:vitamin D3 hydroxylase-associated protein-like isoform X2 [Ruditapes philippinarum]|nr:vitamin D3 hydroxylase-associated protein-like isoform X2 [Ruditapes philippinarum]